MRSVTFLIDDFDYTGHARQVSLLAPALKALGRHVEVVNFGADRPLAQPIRDAGINLVQPLAPGRFAIGDILRSRRQIMSARDGVLHVFGRSAMRSTRLLTFGVKLPRVVVSLTGHERLGPLDGWLVRSAWRIVVPHPVGADTLMRQGIAMSRIAVVPLAVDEVPLAPDRDAFCRRNGLPGDAPLFISAGRMAKFHDTFPVIWTFSFIHYSTTDARLLLIGDGPARASIQAAAREMAPEMKDIFLLGGHPDVPRMMGVADVAISAKVRGGANVVLEAMAAGRPVIAWDNPDLRAIIENEKTGFLLSSRSPPEMARQMRNLLADPAQRAQVGEAARAAVRKRHSIDAVRNAMSSIYGD